MAATPAGGAFVLAELQLISKLRRARDARTACGRVLQADFFRDPAQISKGLGAPPQACWLFGHQ